jgi:hypothetical protein
MTSCKLAEAQCGSLEGQPYRMEVGEMKMEGMVEFDAVVVHTVLEGGMGVYCRGIAVA